MSDSDLDAVKLVIFEKISTLMERPLSSDQILQEAMWLIDELLQADAGSILVLDGDELIFKVVVGEKEEELVGRRMPDDVGIAGWVVQHEEPLLVSNPRDDPRFYEEIDKQLDYYTETLLCVPIRSKARTVGAIELLNKRGGRRFTAGDLEILSTLAGQVAVLLENAWLAEEREAKIEELQKLIEVTEEINSTQALDVVLERIVANITTVMRAEAGSILLIDADGDELYFKVATGERGEQVKEIRVPIEGSIAGWVATYDQPLLVPDVSVDDRHYEEADHLTGFKTRSILCAPLEIRGETIGVVEAVNRVGHPRATFQERDLELLKAFANQAALAIEGSRLYTNLEAFAINFIEAFVAALDRRNGHPETHSLQVARYAVRIGERLGLDGEALQVLRFTALLHDIGKIGIREQALLGDETPARKTERTEVHARFGAKILERIEGLRYDLVIPAVRYQDEHYDGSGPERLAGEEIPSFSRIIAVADRFVERREAIGAQRAVEELEANAGKQFDSEVVSTLATVIQDERSEY
ncbi:MAG: GAF domain-containing protein [Candidatus Bipolaricaulia bacterium]